jgi:hypothetical protein
MKQFLHKHNRAFFVLYSSLIVLLLLITMTGFWLQQSFFNTQQFTSIATQSITQQSSLDSIARKAVDTALADRPLIRTTLGPKLEAVMSGALGSDVLSKTFRGAIERMQLLITTPRHDPIVLDLTQVKGLIASGQSVVSKDTVLGSVDTAVIPDSIMLIDTAKIPNLYQYGIWVFWIGPGALLLATVGSLYWVYRGGRKLYLLRISIVAGLVAIAGVLGYIMGPLIRPGVISIAPDVPSQTILNNIYTGFIEPFSNTALVVLATGFIVAIVAFTLHVFFTRYRIKVDVQKRHLK